MSHISCVLASVLCACKCWTHGSLHKTKNNNFQTKKGLLAQNNSQNCVFPHTDDEIPLRKPSKTNIKTRFTHSEKSLSLIQLCNPFTFFVVGCLYVVVKPFWNNRLKHWTRLKSLMPNRHFFTWVNLFTLMFVLNSSEGSHRMHEEINTFGQCCMSIGVFCLDRFIQNVACRLLQCRYIRMPWDATGPRGEKQNDLYAGWDAI